jgi:hypothetical protein
MRVEWDVTQVGILLMFAGESDGGGQCHVYGKGNCKVMT